MNFKSGGQYTAEQSEHSLFAVLIQMRQIIWNVFFEKMNGPHITRTNVISLHNVLKKNISLLYGSYSVSGRFKRPTTLTSTEFSCSLFAKPHSLAAVFKGVSGVSQGLLGCCEMSLFPNRSMQWVKLAQNTTSSPFKKAARKPGLQ